VTRLTGARVGERGARALGTNPNDAVESKKYAHPFCEDGTRPLGNGRDDRRKLRQAWSDSYHLATPRDLRRTV